MKLYQALDIKVHHVPSFFGNSNRTVFRIGEESRPFFSQTIVLQIEMLFLSLAIKRKFPRGSIEIVLNQPRFIFPASMGIIIIILPSDFSVSLARDGVLTLIKSRELSRVLA